MSVPDICKTVSCPVCLEGYSQDGERRPRLLCCGHSLCEACGGRLVGTATPSCPVCRQQFTPPGGGFTALPVNTAIAETVEFVEAWRASCCCHRHVGKFAVYCVTCQRAICALCYMEQHHKHDVITIDEAAGRFRVTLRGDVDEVDKALTELETVKNVRRQYDEKLTEVEKRIEREKNAKIALIEKQTRTLLQELNELRGRRRNIRELDQRISSLRSFLDACRRLLDQQSYEVVLQGNGLHDRGVVLTRLPRVDPEELRVPDVDFRPLVMRSWIPMDRVNLIGELLTAERPGEQWSTWLELTTHLEESRDSERNLQTQLRAAEERQRRQEASSRELMQQQKQQFVRQLNEALQRERSAKEELRLRNTELIEAGEREAVLELQLQNEVSLVRQLELAVASQEQVDRDQRNRLSQLTERQQELLRQLRTEGKKREQLAETVQEETEMRRNAEWQARQSSYRVEDIVEQLDRSRQQAEQREDELQERLVAGLRHSRDQAQLEVTRVAAEAADRETSVRRENEARLVECEERVRELTLQLHQSEQREMVLRQQQHQQQVLQQYRPDVHSVQTAQGGTMTVRSLMVLGVAAALMAVLCRCWFN